MVPSLPRPPRGASAVLALAVLLLGGCRAEPPPPEGAAGRTYSVRGELVRLRASEPREVLVRHEAIPEFADRMGAVVGMGAMVMPFPVAPGVPLDGLAPGDKVRLRFRMDWERNRVAVESIETLPKDTALEFGPARRVD